ncbi:MAG: ATP-dependent DNA ligase [Oryzihumus sp.]
MLLAEVVATSAAVAATASRNAKVGLLADLLGRTPAPDVAVVARLVSGQLRQRRTGIELAGWRDLPEAAPVATVTVGELDAAMQRASELSGPGSATARAQLVAALLGRLTAAEQVFLVGVLREGLRQGAGESLVLAATARAAGAPQTEVRRAVTVSGSLAAVAEAALIRGPAALAGFSLTVGQGVGPMLAASGKDLGAALERTGPAGVEWKLDGIRAQLHRDGSDVRVLTRSLEDITDRVPEVVEAVAALPLDRAILDGELIALRPDGRPRPFQETGGRTASRVDPEAGRRTTPLTAYLFDVLHLQGQDLIDEPGDVRRAALEQAVPGGLLTPRLAVPDPGDPAQVAAARAFADDALARGHEGVVVKADTATYDMGRRGSGWVKVKPVHTLDLVILAVERGSGRRSGWLSNLHLGARDPHGRFGPPGGFVMLGKTFKGLTDEMLRWQTEVLPRHADGPTDGYVVRLRPEVVVEIAFDGVQASSRYPAGLALRFARVVRHRPDKSPAEADVIEAVEAFASP